jgi:hypothetical protein
MEVKGKSSSVDQQRSARPTSCYDGRSEAWPPSGSMFTIEFCPIFLFNLDELFPHVSRIFINVSLTDSKVALVDAFHRSSEAGLNHSVSLKHQKSSMSCKNSSIPEKR